MKPIRESILLLTSAASDVQDGNGNFTVAGLRPISKKNIVSLKQVKYRVEVPQVVTVGASLYTPTANTNYTIEIYDPNRKQDGYQESAKLYGYLTPPSITTIGATAALQREYINTQIIAKINARSNVNHSVAATLGGGNGFTITDQGGYYPIRSQSMTNVLGQNIVIQRTNVDGTGFTANDIVLTTAAVTSSGNGAKLLQ